MKGRPLDELMALHEKWPGKTGEQVFNLDKSDGVKLQQLELFDKERPFYEVYNANQWMSCVMLGDSTSIPMLVESLSPFAPEDPPSSEPVPDPEEKSDEDDGGPQVNN